MSFFLIAEFSDCWYMEHYASIKCYFILVLWLVLINSLIVILMLWQEAKVPLKEYEFNEKKVQNLQSHLVSSFYINPCSVRLANYWILDYEQKLTRWAMQEKIVGENYYLNQSAKDAYRSYILAYNSHSMKNIFNVHSLNLKVWYWLHTCYYF